MTRSIRSTPTSTPTRPRPVRRLVRLGVLGFVLALLGMSTFGAPTSQADGGYVPISGAGSTWSQVAIDAWRADVRSSGLVVNFAGTGSTDGRSQFIQSTVDFATSEIPFENPPEPGQQAEIPSRPYAYLPIVAGGTSFMYNLTLGGQRVTDLRLSGTTLAKIFTGQITRWNDPEITKDYGKQLPDIPIIPVVRSDGAGASAQFTLYMQNQAPSVYCPFIRSKEHLSGTACPSVSFYPSFGNSKAQVGSNGVANYVSASYGVGSIGYVEYAYAKRIDFPVVGLLNKAGYFAQPTAANVAVALTKAKINPNLTENLTDVYNNPDPRAYPMSSYSYMIIPTSTAAPMNTDKGKTLSTFINYFLCTGQQKADILGYSPLPTNLVEAGFAQVKKIPGAVPSPPLSQCHNPALEILKTAPQPDPCSKYGATCAPGQGSPAGTLTDPTSGSSPSSTSTTGTSGTTHPGTGPGSSTSPGTSTQGTSTSSQAPPAASTDPLTGRSTTTSPGSTTPNALTGNATTTTGTGTTSTSADYAAPATPLELTSARTGQGKAIAWLTGLMLLLAVLAPPLVVRRLRRPQA